jgi:hypothetical protein
MQMDEPLAGTDSDPEEVLHLTALSGEVAEAPLVVHGALHARYVADGTADAAGPKGLICLDHLMCSSQSIMSGPFFLRASPCQYPRTTKATGPAQGGMMSDSLPSYAHDLSIPLFSHAVTLTAPPKGLGFTWPKV